MFGGTPKVYTATNANPPFFGYQWSVPAGWTYYTSGNFNETLNLTSISGNLNDGNITVIKNNCISTTVHIDVKPLLSAPGGTSSGGRWMKLWPNPNHGSDLYFDVDFENEAEPGEWTIKIFNMNAVQVFSQTYNGDLPRSIDVSNLGTGNYVFYVQHGDIMQTAEFARQQ